MSYATYLANKLASQQKVVTVKKPTDASMITQKRRFEANQIFFADGQGVGSLAMDTTRPDGIPLLQHPSTSYRKTSTRPAAASDYTAFRGHQGIRDDAAYTNGGRKNLLCVQYPGGLSYPAPDSEKYRSASDATRSNCADCYESHNPATLGESKFVDNTIRLSAMHPEMVTGGCCDNSIVEANHTHSSGINPPTHPSQAVGKRSEIMRAPPEFQNQGVGGARIGAYYNPRSGYVENKHGNDLGVNPRRTPTPWVYTPGAPAHLKINDPKFGNVK